jgi:hypothetical protein
MGRPTDIAAGKRKYLRAVGILLAQLKSLYILYFIWIEGPISQWH